MSISQDLFGSLLFSIPKLTYSCFSIAYILESNSVFEGGVGHGFNLIRSYKGQKIYPDITDCKYV